MKTISENEVPLNGDFNCNVVGDDDDDDNNHATYKKTHERKSFKYVGEQLSS